MIQASVPRPHESRSGPAQLAPVSNVTRERFVEMVKRCKEYIHAGDIFQVVPSQRFTLPETADPLAIYRELRLLNPSPYLFFMRCGGHVVLGSSPEIHVRLTDGLIELRPLAGTSSARRHAGGGPRDREAPARGSQGAGRARDAGDLGRNDVGGSRRSAASWSTSSR